MSQTGVFRYVEAEGFEVLLFGYSFDGCEPVVCDIHSGGWNALPADVFEALFSDKVLKTAYNAQFEIVCLSKSLWPLVKELPAYAGLSYDDFVIAWMRQWECTMQRGLYYGYPSGLDAIGEAIKLEAASKKDRRGKALINYFSQPDRHGQRALPEDSPDKWAVFKEYCRQDVITETAVRNSLPELPVSHKNEWITDFKSCIRGVGVDLEFVEQAIKLANQETESKKSKMMTLTGLKNPNSPQQLKEWLAEQLGREFDSLNKTEVAELLLEYKEGPVHDVLSLRQEIAKTSTAKYIAAKNCACSDGRIRGVLQFYGAGRTGRWAGRLIQVQNLPQNHIDRLGERREAVKIGSPLPDIPVMSQLSQLIRTALVPHKDYKFVVADFSAIEARIIAWLAGEKWREDVFRKPKSEGGGKIYEASAAKMFGVPIETIVKGHENYALRQKGKIAELALGYGGSKGAMRAMGAKEEDFSDSDLYGIINRWRATSPNIVDLWRKVEEKIISANSFGKTPEYCRRKPDGSKERLLMFTQLSLPHGGNCAQIHLPSGRALNYVNLRFGSVKKYDRIRDNAIVYDGINQTTHHWEAIDTYGGKLVENIVQAIARDCLMVLIRRLEAAGFKLVMHIHDEVVVEVEAYEAESKLAEILALMRKPIEWAPDLMLDADGFIGDYYKKD